MHLGLHTWHQKKNLDKENLKEYQSRKDLEDKMFEHSSEFVVNPFSNLAHIHIGSRKLECQK